MKESDVQRYDLDHPACSGYYCCGGGRITPQEGGFYVTYDDYEKVESERGSAKRDAARWAYVRKRGVVVPTMTLPWGEHIAEGVVGDGHADRCVDELIARAARAEVAP